MDNIFILFYTINHAAFFFNSENRISILISLKQAS